MTRLFLLLSLLSACTSKKTFYQDSSNKFYVTIEKTENNGDIDSLFTFYNFDNLSEVKKVGFYKDGFRNDLWHYNLPTGVKTIKWGHYKDKYLNFETNIFSHADSAKYGEFFTKLLFTTDEGPLALTISVNGPLKDSLPEKNYERVMRNEFKTVGLTPIRFSTRKINNKPNDIFVSHVAVEMAETNEVKYSKAAYSFINKNCFIEFSVVSGNENNSYADILFDAVLTNFYIDGKWLYNPLSD